jgi:DNA-binding transcriptional MerR regulator
VRQQTADGRQQREDSALLKISELAEAADVPVATVRHYLREGLLPEPVKTSRNMAYYPPEFVDRIRLIKRLQEERFMPLRVIRDILLAERTSREDVLARFELPARALDRLAEVGVLSPDEDGYSPADVRVLAAIARFRAEGWNETTGFGARDVARLMKGLEPVVADELELMVERFAALDPDRAAQLMESGMSPFPDLIGALHAKVLTDELERQRSRREAGQA